MKYIVILTNGQKWEVTSDLSLAGVKARLIEKGVGFKSVTDPNKVKESKWEVVKFDTREEALDHLLTTNRGDIKIQNGKYVWIAKS